MKMFTTSRAKKIMAVALAAVISMTFSSSDVTSLGSVLAAEDELQYYDKSKSIKINLDDNGEELGSIWFDGEKYYDHNPDDEIGIEYPSGEWNVTKEIEGTDYTITAKIPAGAFDRRVGFYARIKEYSTLSEEQIAVLEQNDLSEDDLCLFDIGFKDLNSEDTEPLKEISLSIKMAGKAAEAEENGDPIAIDVYHIDESNGIALDKVASIEEKKEDAENNISPETKADGITVEGSDVIATFETASFSVFVIHDYGANKVVTFDSNNEVSHKTKSMAAVKPQTSVKLDKNTFEYEGHIFRCWNTVPNPTVENPGVEYADGEYIIVNDDITLYAQWGDHAHDSSWIPINNASQLPQTAGDYKVYLASDITVNSTWNIPAGTTTLCLNGHKMSWVGGTTSRIIVVGSGATFNLEDCGAYKPSTPYTVNNPNGGTGSIYTGLITGGKSGAVQVVHGTFNMHSGAIAGNVDSNGNYGGQGGGGAGVIVGENNGSVQAPIAEKDSIFNMYGGDISYNHSTSWAAGGIRGQGNAIINISGGNIQYNRSYFGGGISNKQNVDFTFSGGVISNNVQYGGGGYTQGGGGVHFGTNYIGTASFIGGYIENNTVTSNSESGGGVQITGTVGSPTFIFGNVTIRNNVAPTGGGVSFTSNGSDANFGNISIQMKDSPYILENKTTGGVINNVNLINGKKIQIIGAMDSDDRNARVGVTVSPNPTADVFTTGYGYSAGNNKGVEPRLYFVSDNTAYTVIESAGEAKLSDKHIHRLDCHHSTDGEQIEFTPWTSANSLPASSDFSGDTDTGSWYLTTDVTLSNTWTLPSGKTVNLCLNGHQIKATGGTRIMSIGAGTLNLTDCDEETEHTITSPVDGNSKTIYGGLITGVNGGLAITGNFNMYGGTIAGTSIADYGGAIVQNAGVVNIYGGAISYNKSNGGGGARILGGTFNLHDGRISNNEAPYGGGLAPTFTSVFNMTGGKVVENRATGAHDEYRGGGINLGANFEGTANITGGEILNNSGYGAGLHIATKLAMGADITIGSVIIKDNQAISSNGSGISSGYGKSFKMYGKPVITGNTVDGVEKNVYVQHENKIIIVGPMEKGAKVGITMQTPGVFTTDYGYTDGFNDDVDPAVYFTSDDPNYEVLLHNNAEGKLGVDNHRHKMRSTKSYYEDKEDVNAVDDGQLKAYETDAKDNAYNEHAPEALDPNIKYTRWYKKDSLPGPDDIEEDEENYYYLAHDVELTDTWICDDKITICLDGHSITKASGTIIKVTANGVLRICDPYDGIDSSENKKAGYIGDTSSGGAINIVDGKVKWFGGSLKNNKSNKGAGVYINGNGTFELYNGAIKENIANPDGGGGIRADSGNVYIYGGAITDNKSTGGGGVHLKGESYLEMQGGYVCRNSASQTDITSGGGGLNFAVDYLGESKVLGGIIDKNTCAGYGGGIRIRGGVKITISGSEITNNESGYGGGIAIVKAQNTEIIPTVIFDKGIIRGNKANEMGAGIYLDNYMNLTLKNKSDSDTNVEDGYPVIEGNISAKESGGIHVVKGATLKLSGNPIVWKNKAKAPDRTSDIVSNICLPKDDGKAADQKYNIIIEGKLTDQEDKEPKIGITKEPMENSNTIRFTTGYGYSKSSVQNEDGTNSTEYHYKSEGGGINPAGYFFSDAAKNYQVDHALSPYGDLKVLPYTDRVEAMLTPGYIIEYHSPIDAPVANAGFVTDDTASRAKWNDHYQEESGHEDSPYSKVDQTSPVETYFEEIAVEEPATGSEPAKVPKATEPKDPTWNPKTGYVFSGWVIVNTDGTADVQTTTEYSFGKEIKKSLKLNATWEQVPADDKGSYVGGLVGYAEDNITFTDCNVAATSSTGLLLRSESYSGYAGGYLGYGMKAVAASGTGQTNVRLYGSILGGLCGSQEPTGTDTYSSFSVSGITTNGYVIAHPNDPKSGSNTSFIPYRLVAGEYIGRPLADGETVPTHDHTEFKFYDASILTGGPGTSTSITSVVRPNHRYYQPKLPTSGDQTERDVDPLKDVDTATPYGEEGN